MSRSAHDDMVNGRMGRRVARLLREEGNIARALDYALASESRHNSALAILGYLTLYLKARGDYRRTLMLGWAAAQKEVSPTIERARALLCIAVMSVHVRSEAGQVTPLLEEATRLAQLHGDAWIEGYACGYRALLLVDVGRHEEADSFADEVLRIATERNNLLLLGLAALTRGWVHLARGDCASAIHVMQSARDLGDDPHQRHFLHMYIGLALFRLGDYGAAACQWREGMRGAAAVSNTRGLGGAIEGCGYLAEQLGHANEAVRMLTAAHRLRQRTEMPLFSHWLPHHESAIRRLRSTLGPTEYAVCVAAGEALRIEDAVNETTFLLQRFGACTEANSVVATA